MNINDRLLEDNQVVSYINESLRMIYYNEKNEKKIFWWWLNKFEYIANVINVPDSEMAELFIKMVHENIHERVKKKYPAIDFNELSYEEIINHYICYFNYSSEILSHRKSYQDRNYDERKAIKRYAKRLRDMYNNGIYINRLEQNIANQYIYKFHDIKITKYLEEIPVFSLRYEAGINFAKNIELARYINPALSMIKVYNSKNIDKIHDWLLKLEYVANMIKLPDDKMIDFFNNMVDNDVHLTVETTYPHFNLSNYPYEEARNFYLQYFDRSYDLNKTRLICRKQYKDETIENYANSIRKLSEKCSHIEGINKIQREQFVIGIRDDEIRTLLNKFSSFSFDELIELAIELTNFKKITTYLKPTVSLMRTYNQITEGAFYEWFNKFEYLIDIIGVRGKQSVEFFKNMVHNDVHIKVKEHNPSVNFSEHSFEHTVNYYFRCLYDTTELYSHRQRFMCRKQYENETFKHFADSLWKIQYDCKQDDYIDERLRYQFRSGIYDKNIKTYIDKYPDLSFDVMVGIAIQYSNELFLMENE